MLISPLRFGLVNFGSRSGGCLAPKGARYGFRIPTEFMLIRESIENSQFFHVAALKRDALHDPPNCSLAAHEFRKAGLRDFARYGFI